MEYSSTKKVRLPGISTLLIDHDSDDDDDHSYDSRDHREEITPHKTAYNTAQFQTPPNHAGAKSSHRRPSTGRKLKRSTLSPSSNQIIHATAEALAAHPVEGATIGQVIIDKLDDFGESVWNRWSALGGRSSRGASVTGGGIQQDDAEDDDYDDDDDSQDESGSTVRHNVGGDGTDDNQHFTLGNNVDDSFAHSLNNSHAPSPNIIASPSLPHEEDEEVEQQQQQQQQQQYASPNTTQSTEESFYIGFGEEGFCPSMSIHESDISESGSDEEQLEESIHTEDAEEDEEEDGAEGVDSSIFTHHIEEESPGHTARRASEEKRVLEDSNWEDEKKEDSNQKASTDGTITTNHLATEDPSNESRDRASAIPSPLSGCRIAPSPQTPAPRQQAERDDNSLDSKDYVSSSLKNYLTLQEDKLSSLLSSIAGLTATPARIESAVQDEFSKEEDLDSMVSVPGLMTPLRSRLERVELSDCDESGADGYRGGMVRHSPPEFGRMKAWNEFDSSKVKSKSKLQEVGTEHRGGMLLHSPQGLLHVATSSLTASGLEKASNEFDSLKVKSKWKLQEEAEHRGGMLLHSPPGLLQDAASSLRASGLQTASNEYDSSTMKSSSKLMQEEAEYTGGMLRHSPPSHAAPSLTFADLENAGSSSATEQKFKEKTPNGAPQSPLLNQNDNIHPKDDLKTPSVDTSASSIASALDIAAAEFSTKSTELMEYLQKAMTTERTTKSTVSSIDISKTSHVVTKNQGHLGQSGPTSSPTVLSPFVNLRPQVSKESKIPSEDLDGIPASLREMFENAESILEKELASPVLKGAITRTALADIDTFCEDYIKPPSDSKPVEGSPTECVVIDTDTLDGTDINLDSLKGAFLKAESQLESAASSIVQRTNPHENDSIEDDGEDDTTFDTANFSLGALAAAADDFFDSRESPNVVEINGDKVATQDAVGTMEVNSSFMEMDIDSSNPMFEHKQASAECKADLDVPMLTDDLSRTQLTDGDHGSDEEKKKVEESQFVTRGLRPQLSDSGSHTAASIADENVDITLTLARVGDYLKRMTMADRQSISNCEEGFSMDASTDGTLKTIGVPRLKTSIDSPSNLGATSFLPDQNILQDSFSTVNAVDERPTQNDATTPRACNVLTLESSIVDHMDESIDSPKDLMSAATVKTGSPAKKINETTPSECSAANLESSKGSEDVDESMFMPNVSMEVMTATSPIPAAAERPLQAMSEEDEDSGALSDEEFFPNRDLSRKSTPKVAASCSVEEKSIPSAVKTNVDVSTRAFSLSLGRTDRNVTRREHSSKANNVTNLPPKSSRLSHPVASTSSRRSIPMSKSSPRSTNSSQSHEQKSNSPAQHHPKVSAPSAAFRLRQTNRTAVPPTSPPSNVKPARKRTKLSTITNTSTTDSVKETAKTATKTAKISPKTVETVSSVSKATTATDKKIMSHAATKEVDVPRKAASASLTKHTVSVNTRKETNHVVISPRTSSMRRSLVAVAKSQRQSKIPKPKPSPRDSVPPSERLAQLAKPRSVVQKENPPSPKKVTRKKLAATKPPTLLSRESKKSKVKSTEEIEAEQMSTIRPFKANKMQGSSWEVKSRFNTPRAATPNQTSTDESNPKPFISLKEAIDKYNFREPAAVATPINTKKLRDSTPSFLEREMSKPPKQNVPTLAESIKSYDFRATVASTPTNPKTRPPSFLNRPVAVHLPKSSEELELEECKNKFKACPIPISSTSKLRPPSRPREGRTLTTPRPPKLHTSMRSGQLKTPVPSEDEIELSKQFHARPLPVSLYGSRFATSTPIRHYERTPQPSTDEVELSKQFHALPLPTEIYGTTIENDGTPFHIRAEQQYEKAQERRRKLFEDEMEELRRSRERKATPLPKTNWEAKPILIEKSNVELVQPRPPRLSLDVRSRSRKQFDEYVHQVREADAAAKEAKLAAEAEAEEAEIRRKRALSIDEGGFCFRARPISIKYE